MSQRDKVSFRAVVCCIVNSLSKGHIIISKTKYLLNQQNNTTGLKSQKADLELCQNSVLRDTVNNLYYI